MAGVHHDSNEYIRMTKLGEEPTNLQSLAHSIQEASSTAAKDKSEQAFNKALADARRRQEKEEFKAIAGLRLGRSVSTANVDDLVISDGKDDNVVVVGDGLDSSGLSGGGEQENSTQRPRTSSLGAQPTARGGRGRDVGSPMSKRALLQQSLANSAAKNPDGNCWFDKGKKPKKA